MKQGSFFKLIKVKMGYLLQSNNLGEVIMHDKQHIAKSATPSIVLKTTCNTWKYESFLEM